MKLARFYVVTCITNSIDDLINGETKIVYTLKQAEEYIIKRTTKDMIKIYDIVEPFKKVAYNGFVNQQEYIYKGTVKCSKGIETIAFKVNEHVINNDKIEW